jgi:hypothetical protein
MDPKQMVYEDVTWIHLDQDEVQGKAFVAEILNLQAV